MECGWLRDTIPRMTEEKKSNELSLAGIAEFAEKLGKIAAVGTGLLYVLGFLIYANYYSALHIRSFELLQTRYFFAAFYYFAFLAIHLVVPWSLLNRWWSRTIYGLILSVVLIFFNEVNQLYLQSKIEIAYKGSSYFNFTPTESSIIVPNAILLLFGTLGSVLIFGLAKKFWQLTTSSENLEPSEHKRARLLAAGLLVGALWLNWQVFARSVFPNIQEPLGGGRPVIVKLEFQDDVPLSMKLGFNTMEGQPKSDPEYYAQLIYMDDKSVFLKEPNWFTDSVYEFRREQILALQYTNFNPVGMGKSQPKK